jgi:hypothetical protein
VGKASAKSEWNEATNRFHRATRAHLRAILGAILPSHLRAILGAILRARLHARLRAILPQERGQLKLPTVGACGAPWYPTHPYICELHNVQAVVSTFLT